jgi:hypothetical protein
MNDNTGRDEIKVWQFARAPKPLQRLAAAASEWIVLIPASLDSPQIEALFLRWESETHRVIRRKLANGSILLAGSYPSEGTMTSSENIKKLDEAKHPSSKSAARSRTARSGIS